MFSIILEASRPSYLGARKWVRTVRSTRYLWHLASMAESILIDMFWKPFENRIGLGNMLNVWQFMLTNATLEVYIEQLYQSMFSKICNYILKICQSMFPSIWEASRPSYWGARKWVRTVPSTRYLWHLASMAQSIWIDMFWNHFENRVGLRNMLKICKSMLNNTILEAYVEQICQSLFSKLCHRILKICQSMFSSIWEASRPSYWGARKWVRTFCFLNPRPILSARYLWHLGFLAKSCFFRSVATLKTWICVFPKYFEQRALTPEYSTKSPNKLICRGSNEVVSRGVDVRVALSTPAGQRFTL